MYIVITMSKRGSPGGWVIEHGHSWPVYPDMSPAVSTITEAQRHDHFYGENVILMDTWVLDYHFQPGVRFRTGARFVDRTPGTWHLYPPGIPYWQDTTGADLPLRAIWIRFHRGEAIGLLTLVRNRMRMARIRDPQGVLLARLSTLARMADTCGDTGYLRVVAGFLEMVAILLEADPTGGPGEYVVSPQPGGRPVDALVTRANEYLSKHVHETVTLDHMARHLNTSVSSLERRYSATTGEGVMKAFARLRIARVKQLVTGGCSIGQAAEQLGFCDQFHLSKSFRRAEGVSPREYLRRLKTQTALR